MNRQELFKTHGRRYGSKKALLDLAVGMIDMQGDIGGFIRGCLKDDNPKLDVDEAFVKHLAHIRVLSEKVLELLPPSKKEAVLKQNMILLDKFNEQIQVSSGTAVPGKDRTYIRRIHEGK